MHVGAPTWKIDRRHRVAIVGFGGVVQACHMPGYRALGESLGIDVVAAVEPDEERRRVATEEYGVEFVFSSLSEMLEVVRPEIVDVTVPPDSGKADVIRECLTAGCHVLAQKPFLYDLFDAAALVDEAEAAGRLLAINMQARYAPAFYAARELISSGAVGELRSATIGSTFPLPGDTTVDMVIHEMDLLRYWTGLDPRRVRATVTPLDEAQRSLVLVEVDFGPAAGLVVEECHAPVAMPWSFRIVGSDAVLDGHDQFGTVEPAALTIHRPGGEQVPVELSYSYQPDAFAHVMASLLEALEVGTPAPTSARDHLPALAACLAARRASQTADWEPLEPVVSPH
ncbi:MAG: Gfo/Idh/MocA family oxidoreductase [Actinobacteria bacterium]|nr:Gfo/Idh/MocA family oxidoreductase [Actinomycetota bacterium]